MSLLDTQPAEAFDGVPPAEVTPEEPGKLRIEGALAVLRRGLRESPELRAGLGWTLGLAVVMSGGRVVIPILLQQIFDKGINGPSGFRPGFVYGACGLAGAVIVAVYLAGRTAYRRLVTASENALFGLRVRVFAHIHQLSLAEQTAERRGAFVSRVTADIDTLGHFMEWGGISWITSTALMVVTLVVMCVYSWRLTLVSLVLVSPLFFIIRHLQHRMLAAYDRVRTRVGETLSEVSESVMGAAVVRAYGLEGRTRDRLGGAIRRQYQAEVKANFYQATIFPMNDVFGSLAVAGVVIAGAHFTHRWGLSLGQLLAFLFLINLFLQPMAELSETFDMTQTAVAGWRKVLGVLDLPVEVVEPSPGSPLPGGALAVDVEDLTFAYREGGPVLLGLDVHLPPGAHVAIVGETGSGKTTFAKLLCRLADPPGGRILLSGVDLREVARESRQEAVRMVPQDGFLFDTTVRENILMGRPGATDADVTAAVTLLGLDAWVASLPDGLETRVGERGENLSVGERQLAALARAQLGSPGLLILDEATSAVDPETERSLTRALERLSEGRTTVMIAHRLSTAEAADLVLVFDRGQIVERGSHQQLVAAGGVYAALYRSWLGNTRDAAVAD